jgi:hypothetical protein
MKLLIIIFASAAYLLIAQGGAEAAQKTKAQLGTEITTNLPSNGQGEITAAVLRQVLQDMVDSNQQILLINAQTGISYTFVAADQGKLVTFNNASPVAVTLPGASGDFASGWSAIAQNIGTGAVTISAEIGTINGGASITLQAGQIALIISAGLNSYRAVVYGVMVSVTCGSGLSGGTITTTGTCSITDTISAGGPTGSTSVVPVITYNSRGQLTSVTTATITPGSISAMPDPTGTGVAIKNSATTSITRSITGTASNITVSNGDGISGNPTIDLATVNANTGSFGSGTQIPVITAESKGRITAITTATNAPNQISSTITSTRGAFYYLGASNPVLSAINCPTGQIIASGGPGADPSCISASGTGTVTSITQGAGLVFSASPLTAAGTISADVASTSNIWSESSNKMIDAAGAASSLALVGLSDAATIAVDFNTLINGSVTLGGSRTLGNPTNASGAVGRCGRIYFTQDATGSRTLSYSSNWKFPAGVAPTLSTTPAAVDMLSYCVRTSTAIDAVLNKDFR